jgi:4a-hydroxytetrahydrobiopterin dehydratase
MNETEITKLLSALPGWGREGTHIFKTYQFKDHYEAVAFVNAVAWISHKTDHHPEIFLGYDSCKLAYTTHSLGELSQKDFTCAARVEALFS